MVNYRNDYNYAKKDSRFLNDFFVKLIQQNHSHLGLYSEKICF